MRKVVDLTHLISEDMPVYPGTEGPKLEMANTYEKDGFRETLLTMYSHTGTHMDSPAHIVDGKITLDQFDAAQFVGDALVINCTDLKEGDRITMDKINSVRDLADKAEFILFRMGWDLRWNDLAYFGDYPYITSEVAQYLIDTKKKGVGLDVIGIDPIADENLTIHRQLFENAEIVVIENLKNLDKLGSELFLFAALPLKFDNADGAPIRAVAIL